MATLHRHRGVLAGALALGAAAVIVVVVLVHPPRYVSTSQVLLPTAQQATGEDTARDVETLVSIAESDVVLGEAGRALEPPVPLHTLERQVNIEALTSEVLEFEARADSAPRAEEIAQAVAVAEVGYVEDSTGSLSQSERAVLAQRRGSLEGSLRIVDREIERASARIDVAAPGSVSGLADAAALARLTAERAHLVLQIDEVRGQLAGAAPVEGAQIIQDAVPGEPPGLLAAFGLPAAAGGGGGLLLASALLLRSARRDRRLRYRDDLADAVGSVVVASVSSRVPGTVAGWAMLLESDTPRPVDALALRQLHRRLESTGRARAKSVRSITVLSLVGDSPALSVGPQMALCAASSGLSTRLTVSRPHAFAAALWTAFARYATSAQPRPNLSVHVSVPAEELAGLTVVLAVVDRQRPDLADSPQTSSAIIAVSPGTATAEELATLALAADEAGLQVDGVVVADPDDLDRTTGRLPAQQREQQLPLPTRLTGLANRPPASTEIVKPRRSQ